LISPPDRAQPPNIMKTIKLQSYLNAGGSFAIDAIIQTDESTTEWETVLVDLNGLDEFTRLREIQLGKIKAMNKMLEKKFGVTVQFK
jgi:hypothetical protein